MEPNMKKTMIVLAGVLLAGTAYADPLTGVDRFICAASQVQICIEADTCYSASPWELDMPEFVVIDLDKNTISTTESSEEKRSTPFNKAIRDEGKIYLQGVEGGRAFSFVVDEATGYVSVAIARDGAVVSVFGSCTDADI